MRQHIEHANHLIKLCNDNRIKAQESENHNPDSDAIHIAISSDTLGTLGSLIVVNA